MAQGGQKRPRRVAERRSASLRSKGPPIAKNKKKKKKQQQQKPISLKNQIRSAERLLRKNIPPEIREAQEKKLEDLKHQQELQSRMAVERQISLRYRKIKFFERRKIERMIRRLEKQQRSSVDPDSESTISDQLAKLKEDLEYVRFFPKTEKYVALFVGDNSAEVLEKREQLRKQIKDNLIAAAASGKDLEETASDDDELLDLSDDDFFLSGSSSDEADADDEWTDKSAREPASSASGKVASGMSSDEKNQRYMADRARMPPPRYSRSSLRTTHVPARLSNTRKKPEYSTSSNTSHSRSDPSSRNWVSSSARADQSSNLSSNSDARKPRRKRRPKKKKQAHD